MELGTIRPLFQDESDVVRCNSAWYLQQTEKYGLLLCFSQDGELTKWSVARRLAETRVEAVQLGRRCPKEIALEGPLDAAEMALSGASVELIAKFRKGFPEDWDQVWPRPPPPPPPAPIPTRRSSKQVQEQVLSPDEEEEVQQQPAPRRRSKRNENDVKPSYDEDDLLLRALRKEEAKDEILDIFGLREEDIEDSDSDDDCSDTWTLEETKSFQRARLILDPFAPDFWRRMSEEFVPTKTVQECQEKWLREASSNSGKGKHKEDVEDDSKVVSEEDALNRAERAAKLGTVRFRRQVRAEWERAQKSRGNLPRRDNLTTPFRSKMQTDSLPQSCCKDISTPVTTFEFGDKKSKKSRLSVVMENGDSDEDDEQQQMVASSPDVLVEVNRDNLDAYVLNLVKEKQKIQNLQNRKKSNQTKRAPIHAASSSTMAQLETDGIQGTMTPGGTVKLRYDKAVFEDEDEYEEVENTRRAREMREENGDEDEEW